MIRQQPCCPISGLTSRRTTMTTPGQFTLASQHSECLPIVNFLLAHIGLAEIQSRRSCCRDHGRFQELGPNTWTSWGNSESMACEGLRHPRYRLASEVSSNTASWWHDNSTCCSSPVKLKQATKAPAAREDVAPRTNRRTRGDAEFGSNSARRLWKSRNASQCRRTKSRSRYSRRNPAE